MKPGVASDIRLRSPSFGGQVAHPGHALRADKSLSHAVALEDLLARRAEPRAVLLQAGLNRTVVSKVLPAKALSVARAGTLLLRRAAMLRQRERHVRERKHEGK